MACCPGRESASMSPDPATGATIEVRDVHRAFEDGSTALGGVSFEVEPGSIAVLVGPSGCGKTTLLRMMGGLDAPTRGSVRVGDPSGRPVTASFAFQEPRLLPWRSAWANVALPLELAGVARAERRERAEEMLERVGLVHAVRRLPGQLSGGMRMRAAIARALVTRPQLLLLDEPFGALDEITRHVLDDLVLQLRDELGMTVVVVTHSIAEAAYLGDRIVVMAPSPGRVQRIIHPARGGRSRGTRSSPAFAALVAELTQSLAEGIAAAEPAGAGARRIGRTA
jgi:NitT/TauT family transport system ATP-binding protein